MAVIALVGNKGGAGKTTLAVNLATTLAKEEVTVLFDADTAIHPCAVYRRKRAGHGAARDSGAAEKLLENLFNKLFREAPTP